MLIMYDLFDLWFMIFVLFKIVWKKSHRWVNFYFSSKVVVSGAACSYEDVLSYIDCSLLSVSLRDEDLDKMAVVESCIQYLHENEFISVHIPPSDEATGK